MLFVFEAALCCINKFSSDIEHIQITSDMGLADLIANNTVKLMKARLEKQLLEQLNMEMIYVRRARVFMAQSRHRQSLGLKAMAGPDDSDSVLPSDDISGFYTNADILLMEAIFEFDLLVTRFQNTIVDAGCVKRQIQIVQDYLQKYRYIYTATE